MRCRCDVSCVRCRTMRVSPELAGRYQPGIGTIDTSSMRAETPHVRIRLLGALAIDDTAIELARRDRVVLARLSIAAGRVVPRRVDRCVVGR